MTPEPTHAASPAPTQSPLLSIPSAMDELLASEPGIYGVVAETPAGKVLYSRNANVPFIAASLYKLVLMAEVYDQRQSGDLSFDEELDLAPEYFSDPSDLEDGLFTEDDIGSTITVSTALADAIQWSNNIAARALLDRVGDDSVNAEAQRLGMTNTHFLVDLTQLENWPPTPAVVAGTPSVMPQAVQFVDAWSQSNGDAAIVTTPADIAHFYQLLLAGKVVSPTASAEMLELLKGQNIDTKFPVLLPKDTVIAHKTGDLDGAVHHDTGIIYAPSGPVILAALSENTPSDSHAEEVIQRLALIAYGTRQIPAYPDTVPVANPASVTPATVAAIDASSVAETAPAVYAAPSAPDEQPTADSGG